jgi:ABC-2 type transport system ATP-binding protein
MHKGQIIACDTPAALRSGLSGEMLDLFARPQRAALSRLRIHPRASHVQIFGERLHLLVADPQADLPALQDDLSKHNIQISDVRQVTASLEDVFIARLEKATTDHGPQTMDSGPCLSIVRQQILSERFT